MVIFVGGWKSQAVRGTAAVLLGLAALVWPDITVLALVVLFGSFVLADGVTILATVFAGTRDRNQRDRLLILQGVVSILAGIVTFAWTGITTLALLYMIAAWAIVVGCMEIVAAIRLRRVLTDEWLIALSGLLALAFGVLLALFPGEGAVALAWLIGSFAITLGIVHLAFAWRLRALEHRLHGLVSAAPHAAT